MQTESGLDHLINLKKELTELENKETLSFTEYNEKLGRKYSILVEMLELKKINID